MHFCEVEDMHYKWKRKGDHQQSIPRSTNIPDYGANKIIHRALK